MKKTMLLFSILVILSLMGCPRSPKVGENAGGKTENTTEQTVKSAIEESTNEIVEDEHLLINEASVEDLEEESIPFYYDVDAEADAFVEQSFNIHQSDFLIVGDEKLLFCDLETRSVMPYGDETETVINALFVDSDHLYYTVSVNDQLSLKMIDLGEDDPQPKFCADWGLTSFDVIDRMMGGNSELRLDKNRQKVMMFTYGEDDDYFSKAKTYDISSGEVGFIPDESCFSKTLSNIPESVSPDGQRMLSEDSSNGVERTFYVSHRDGSDPLTLMVLGFDGQDPEWLPDGSLIYIDWYMKFEVVTPDRTLIEVGDYDNFQVRPFR